jgi:hypothetical protein
MTEINLLKFKVGLIIEKLKKFEINLKDWLPILSSLKAQSSCGSYFDFIRDYIFN